jgi:hypothetical protein
METIPRSIEAPLGAPSIEDNAVALFRMLPDGMRSHLLQPRLSVEMIVRLAYGGVPHFGTKERPTEPAIVTQLLKAAIDDGSLVATKAAALADVGTPIERQSLREFLDAQENVIWYALRVFCCLWHDVAVPMRRPGTVDALDAAKKPAKTKMLGGVLCELPDAKAHEYFRYVEAAFGFWPDRKAMEKCLKKCGKRTTWQAAADYLMTYRGKAHENGRMILSGSYKPMRKNGRYIPGLPKIWGEE